MGPKNQNGPLDPESPTADFGGSFSEEAFKNSQWKVLEVETIGFRFDNVPRSEMFFNVLRSEVFLKSSGLEKLE